MLLNGGVFRVGVVPVKKLRKIWGPGHLLAKERERKGDIIRYVYGLRAEFLS